MTCPRCHKEFLYRPMEAQEGDNLYRIYIHDHATAIRCCQECSMELLGKYKIVAATKASYAR